MSELIPGPYFHCVFTVPDTFNDLHNTHYREFYSALFKASSNTLLRFYSDRGGVPSMIAVLHTWGQTMALHPHIHFLVSGGCLSFDKKRWIASRKDFLFDVKDLSNVFKELFLAEILKRIPDLYINNATRNKNWVVHCTRPFAGAKKVIEYLGRYTYRSSLSNRRILNVENGYVTIDYKDYSDVDEVGVAKHKPMKFTAEEFIRRFLQHIPKSNFRRIRTYGILAGSDREEKLAIAKSLAPKEDGEAEVVCEEYSLEDLTLCSQCGDGHMVMVRILPANGPPPIIFKFDKWKYRSAS